MKKQLLPHAVVLTALILLIAAASYAQVSVTTIGTAVTQNFNTLASTGTSTTLPAGWALAETGTNANTSYTAGTGSSATGDSYSFGTAAADRAFGTLLSGSLTSRIGASFVNNTGVTITSLAISYTGEQWRLGATGRADKLEFAYSTTATSLTSAGYTNVASLDFTGPVTAGTVGALDGNLAANRTAKSFTISGLTIAPGATFWLRWLDTDASGADDGLGIDDFSLTAGSTAPAAPANDLCANAATLSVPSGTVAGTLLSSTFTAPFTQHDVWYKFTATCTGNYTITVNGFSGDVDVELFSGSCPSSTTFLFNSNSTTTTETISESLTAGTYYVRVLAFNAAAQTSTFNISVSSICPCTTPTAGASGLAFSGNTSNSIGGSFSAASPEPTGGYLVVRSTSSSLSANPADGSSYGVNASLGGGTVVANIPATGAGSYAFSSASLSSNTQYYFFVIPYNFQSGTCLHAYGNGVAVSASTYTCPSVSTPSAGSVTATGASISWSAPGGGGVITSYDLQWRTSPAGAFTLVSNVTSPYPLAGLEANTAYDVQVRASNSVCTGGFSSTLTFTTSQLDAPTANAATACADNFIATWSAVDGASGYQLDVSTSPTFVSSAPAADLFFSEYVEGSSSNKYIEIYNGTGAAVNLGDYRLRLFANNAVTPTNDVLLSGSLANGATVVYKNSAATIYGGAATTNTALNFNGNDAVALFKVSTGAYVDIFGNISENPALSWTDGGNTTVNKTLVRKSAVTGGVTTDPALGFPTLAAEWDMYDEDDVTNLGAHAYGSPSFVSGYNSLAVAGTSQAVTGLAPNTTYYYRVRGNSTNSTSDNSNVVSVTTETPLSFDYCPGGITLNTLASVCNGVVNYSDAIVSGTPAATITYSHPSGSEFPLGTTTVTVTASNSCETITCSFDVTVTDNTPPSITCPGNQVLSLDENCTVELPDYGRVAIVSDNCHPAFNPGLPANQQSTAEIVVTQSPLDGTVITGEGFYTVTLTATDSTGNQNSCAFNVTVNDDTAPDAVCQNATVELDSFGVGAVTASQVNNGSSDNCGIASVSVSPSAFGCGDVGLNTVTLTVTDINGNSSNCTATATVYDNIGPVAICQGITVQLNGSGAASITAGDIDFGSYDACGIVSTSVSPDAFGCADIGNNSVTLTVEDDNGNVSQCSGIVNVQDNVAPSAVCQNADVYLDVTGNVSVSAAQLDGGSTDACGIFNLSVSPSSFVCSNVGPNPVTLTVTDNNNNISSCAAVVTVHDNVAPDAVCQNATIQLSALGVALLEADDVDGGSSDACGIGSLTVSKEEFGCEDVGQHTVTLTVTDNNGNTSTCDATVTVQDKIPATPICQNVTVYLDATGNALVTGEMLNNGSFDNCGIASLESSNINYTCADAGDNTATLTVEDNSGNVSNCTSTVTVVDNTYPTALCQDVTVTLSGGTATVVATEVDNGSFDNCAITGLELSETSFGCSDIGSNAVTLTVTDENGLVSTCEATVKVMGAAPTCFITAVPANNTYTGGVPTNIYIGYGPQSVTLQSNMSGGTATSHSWTGSNLSCYNCPSPVFTPTATGVYNFTVTITNNFGCVTTCTITICVLDVRSSNGKVYLSHYPSGSAGCTGSCNTLSISVSAVPAHLAHTCDHLGACTGAQICGTSAKTETEESAISESGEFGVRVYPNPFASEFRLNVYSNATDNISVRVFDVLGQLMVDKKEIAFASDITFGNDLAKGVYLVEVTQGAQTQVVRVVKSE